MAYNHATYLLSNGTAPEFGKEVPVKTAQVGELTVVSNAVCGCDPFMWLDRAAKFTAPNGQHPIYVTVADVSGMGDGSHLREAYLSLMFADTPIVRVDTAITINGEPLGEGEAYGARVGSGTVSFADASAVDFTPDGGEWDALNDIWFERMDNPDHYFEGVANVELPGTSPQTNIILCHSGWGDGFYPIIESYDADGNVNGIHIDLQVLGDTSDEAK